MKASERRKHGRGLKSDYLKGAPADYFEGMTNQQALEFAKLAERQEAASKRRKKGRKQEKK